MFALAVVLLMLASSDADDPADWQCAAPLIEKNYSQRVDSKQLALRISDECARPFIARRAVNELDERVEAARRLTYQYQVQTFISEIEMKIQQARRRDAIPLKR